jgi:hypothetical protein
VLTATNKRLLISESRGDLNRCTPCRGKPDQHAMYAPRSSPRTPGVRFLWAVLVRDNLSLATTKSKQAPTSGRSHGNQRQTSPAIVLGDLIPPPMRQPCSRGEWFWPNGYTATSAYWAHITSMRSIRSILVHGGQPNGPKLTQAGAITLEVPLATYPLPDLSNQLSPLSPNGLTQSSV